MRIPARTVLRLSLRVIAFASALCALSLLMLPLMLALLMLLFDNTAQGVMVLLGTITDWFRATMHGGGALPAYRSLTLDPGSIALAASARMAPCLAGLLVSLLSPARRLSWAAAASFWLLAALFGGMLVGIVLLPAIIAALLLCALASVDASLWSRRKGRTP